MSFSGEIRDISIFAYRQWRILGIVMDTTKYFRIIFYAKKSFFIYLVNLFWF